MRCPWPVRCTVLLMLVSLALRVGSGRSGGEHRAKGGARRPKAPPRRHWYLGAVRAHAITLMLPLRGGSEPGCNDELFVGDVRSECESSGFSARGDSPPGSGTVEKGATAPGLSGDSETSEASFVGLSSGVDSADQRVWGQRKASAAELCSIGSGREVWEGKYWANLEQKKCEILPSCTQAESAAGVRPKSILWGEDCPEASMDPPDGFYRPYGNAIPLNDTWIGEFPDGSPALLRDVCCGAGDTALQLENCYEHSDSRECIDEEIAAYRAAQWEARERGKPQPAPNPYLTTGWRHLKHPGGAPEDSSFDPQKHEGYPFFVGRGGTPSLEEAEDEFSDGQWGVEHFEVGRFVPMARVPLNQQRIWRPGKCGRAEEAEAERKVHGAGMSGARAGDDDSDVEMGFDLCGAGDVFGRQGKWGAGEAGWRGEPEEAAGKDSGTLEADEEEEDGDSMEPVDDSLTIEEPASPGLSEPSCVEMSTAPQGHRMRAQQRDADGIGVLRGDKERWAMMGKEGRVDVPRQLLEGHEFPASAGGINHQVGVWNYSMAEHYRNERLLVAKWRRWRRGFEAEVARRRPPWEAILDPPASRESTCNMSFVDHKGRPFPAVPGRTQDEVFDNTIVSYVKWRLDRAAHRHRFMCEERENATQTSEDPSVSPWIQRDGYRLRTRYTHGGLLGHHEVQYDGDATIYGSREERQKVVDEQLAALRERPNITCWNCEMSEPSQDEAFYRSALARDRTNASALCDYGVLKYRAGEESEAEALFEDAVALLPNVFGMDTDEHEGLQGLGLVQNGDDRVGGGVGELNKDGTQHEAIPPPYTGNDGATHPPGWGGGGPAGEGCTTCRYKAEYCEACAFSPVVTSASNLAVLKAMNGDCERAEQLLRAALSMVPMHDRIMVKLADLLLDEHNDTLAARALYRRAIDLNPAGADVLYSYGLFLLGVECNVSAAEEVLVRGLRVEPLSVPMNWAYAQLLMHGMRRRDQAKDSFLWLVEQEMGSDNADVVTQAAELIHNAQGEIETRYVSGYSGLRQKKRQRLRRVTNTEQAEGEESSELEAALDAHDHLAQRHNTRDPDHEKTVALVRDLARAEPLYQRALALQPGRVDATLGYAALLQERGRAAKEDVRALYHRVISASDGTETCALVSLAEYEGKVAGNWAEAERLYRAVLALHTGDGAMGDGLGLAQTEFAEESEGEAGPEDRERAYVEALCGLAELLIDNQGGSRGDTAQEARSLLERALRVMPDSERAAVAIDECLPTTSSGSSWFGSPWWGWGVGGRVVKGTEFLKTWLGWSAFEEAVLSEGFKVGGVEARGKGARDRGGQAGQGSGATWARASKSVRPQEARTAGRSNLDQRLGGFGGGVQVGPGFILRQRLRRPWALDACVAVCRRHLLSRDLIGQEGGQAGRAGDLGSSVRSLLVGSSQARMGGNKEMEHVLFVEETMLRGILAENPRHVGALVVMAELQQRLSAWVGSQGGGGRVGRSAGSAAQQMQHEYSALLFYKRAWRVSPRAMGVEALDAYAQLLKRVDGRNAHLGRAGGTESGISRKRALSHQPFTADILSEVAKLRDQPSVFEGLLGIHSTRGWWAASPFQERSAATLGEQEGKRRREVGIISEGDPEPVVALRGGGGEGFLATLRTRVRAAFSRQSRCEKSTNKHTRAETEDGDKKATKRKRKKTAKKAAKLEGMLQRYKTAVRKLEEVRRAFLAQEGRLALGSTGGATVPQHMKAGEEVQGVLNENEAGDPELASTGARESSEHKTGRKQKRKLTIPLPPPEIPAREGYERVCMEKAVRSLQGEVARCKRALDAHGGVAVVAALVDRWRCEERGRQPSPSASGKRLREREREGGGSEFVHVASSDGSFSMQLRCAQGGVGSGLGGNTPEDDGKRARKEKMGSQEQVLPGAKVDGGISEEKINEVLEEWGEHEQESLDEGVGNGMKLKNVLEKARCQMEEAARKGAAGLQREARRLLLDSWHAVRANVVSSPWHEESQLVYVRATKRLQSMLSHKPTLAFVDRGKKIGSGGGQLEVVSERSLEVSDIVSDGGWYVLQRAVQAVPSSVTLQVLHAREMMVRGFGIGSKEGASNVFERAVHMEPQSVAAAVALGWWEEQGGGWRRAILQYLRALALLRRATVGGWPESDFVSDFVHATAQNVDKDGVAADAPPQTQALVRQVRDSVATLFRDEGPPGQVVSNSVDTAAFDEQAWVAAMLLGAESAEAMDALVLVRLAEMCERVQDERCSELEQTGDGGERRDLTSTQSLWGLARHRWCMREESAGDPHSVPANATGELPLEDAAGVVGWVVAVDPSNAYGWAGLARERTRRAGTRVGAGLEAWAAAVRLQPYQQGWVGQWARQLQAVAREQSESVLDMAENADDCAEEGEAPAAHDDLHDSRECAAWCSGSWCLRAAGCAGSGAANVTGFYGSVEDTEGARRRQRLGAVTRKGAASMLRVAQRLAPDNLDVLLGAAAVTSRVTASETLERALRLYPQSSRVAVALATALLEGAGREGPGKRARAMDLLQRVNAAKPSAASLFVEASALEEEGSALARGMYREVLRLNPQHVPALVATADLEESDAAAAAAYQRALAADPQHVWARHCWARRCAEGGDVAQALRLYQDVLRLAPGDLAALNEIGLLYWDGQQDASLALAALKRGLEVNDRDAVLVANYGRVLEESGADLGEVEAVYRRAVDLQPDEANSLSSLACLLIARTKSGEVTGSENSGRSVDETESGRSAAAPKHLIEAEDLLRRAVQLEPHHGSATANLAMVLLATSEGEGGDTQQRLEARELVHAALLHDPEHADLLEAAQELAGHSQTPGAAHDCDLRSYRSTAPVV